MPKRIDCKGCGEQVPRTGGRQLYCVPCSQDRRRGYEKGRPKRENTAFHRLAGRKRNIRSKYGVSMGTYMSMLLRQEYRCALCLEFCETGHTLAADHDHTTGKVRGLLCLKCNTSLGGFNDDPTRLLRAVDYLKQHNAETH